MALSFVVGWAVNSFKSQPRKLQIYEYLVNSGLHKVNNGSVTRTEFIYVLEIVYSTKQRMYNRNNSQQYKNVVVRFIYQHLLSMLHRPK
jgi:hypothetical protein